MNRFNSLKLRLRAGAGPAMVAAAIYAASLAFVAGADTNAPASQSGGTQSGEADGEKGGDQETHRRRVVCHQLQPLPPGTVSHRIHVPPNGRHS